MVVPFCCFFGAVLVAVIGLLISSAVTCLCTEGAQRLWSAVPLLITALVTVLFIVWLRLPTLVAVTLATPAGSPLSRPPSGLPMHVPR